MSRKIFISVGEASGDAHAASLMREIRKIESDANFVGLGGPKMAQEGCRCLADVTVKSGMWLKHVVENYFHYRRIFRGAVRSFDEDRPDALVLIDHPVFNVALALRAKERNIPVIYYICPQTWAWGSWRIKKMARRIDKMLVILPFEKAFWQRFGVDAEYVGHPVFDRLCLEDIPSPADRSKHLIGLLPGSRMTEIGKLFPIMLRAAELLHAQFPDVEFRAVCSREEHRTAMRKLAGESGLVEIVTGNAHDLMRTAAICMVASGTASLELAYFRTPMVVLYRVIWLGRPVVAVFASTDYISLVNLLAGRAIVPELCMFSDDSRSVAATMAEFITDESRRQTCIDEMDALCRQIAAPGASARTAKALLDFLDTRGE